MAAPQPTESPVPEAASPRLGDRPAAAVAPSAAAGSTFGLPEQPGYCERHGLAMVPCMYCEHPEWLPVAGESE